MPNTWLQTLFPAEPRWFRGDRWVNIGLRCIHLVGIAGISGGFLFNLDQAHWATYWHLALASGLALALLYFWSTAAWLFQIKGLAVVVKILLLAVALRIPQLQGELFVAIIVISGLTAHAPARIRAQRWLKLPGTHHDEANKQ
jgi:hypothetical protein